MIDYLTSVIEDITIEKGFIEVVDLQLVKDVVLTYSELSPFPRLWGKLLEKGCKGTVIYAPSEVSYGTTRMLQMSIADTHAIANDFFIVVRSKEELESELTKLLASPDATAR
jgi:hypothetical protein